MDCGAIEEAIAERKRKAEQDNMPESMRTWMWPWVQCTLELYSDLKALLFRRQGTATAVRVPPWRTLLIVSLHAKRNSGIILA